MPSSFSRLLDEDELHKIRELYLQSLAALEDEEFEEEEDEDAVYVRTPTAEASGGVIAPQATNPGTGATGEPERPDQ